MGILNIKALNKGNIKKGVQKILKPIVVKQTENGCRTCGGRR